ncbi:MAG: hypothetical protein Kow0065_17560 [Methylomicrobium sp.]
MFRLVYVSSANRLFSPVDFLELLIQARSKNQRLGITGMLLYKDGHFMQVLEGEEPVVRELFTCIERDPRHRDTLILLEEFVFQQDEHGEERAFPDWSMGFRDFADLHNVQGINQFMNYAFNDEIYLNSPSACWDLLTLFRNH